MSINSADLAHHQPLTLATFLLLLLGYYAQAVLAILPNTFLFKLLLLPFILWQGWKCAVRYDHAVLLAQLLGHQNTDRLGFVNLIFVCAVFGIALRTIEWTFIKKPLRRYDPPKRNQDTPIERRGSASTVFLDALDLLGNPRGIGWSWSQNPFPRDSTPPPSIALLLVKILFKLTLFDASRYIVLCVCPGIDNPEGGSIFDPNLALVPRAASAALCGICSGLCSYATMDSVHHIAMLVGRIVYRQPAFMWPRLFHRPWMSTSIQEFWNFRWHQLARHSFVVYGARPGGALFGRPGAVMGAFAVSAILHHVGLWGVGKGTEFITAGGFFLLMGVGVVMEGAFTRATGIRVGGWFGWLWTMVWTILWGTFMVDGWARHGLFATQLLPDGFHPGRVIVDAIIALSNLVTIA